jgi:hypothetical protein
MSRGKRKRRLPPEGSIQESGVEPPPSASSPGRRQLLVLLTFGLAFGGLLIGFLVFQENDKPKEGGGSGVPPGFVATVHSPNGNVVNVSEAEFKRAVELESGRSLKAVPQRGDKRFEDLQASVLSELLKEIWNREEAAAMGLSVTGEEVAIELAQIKAKDYPTETAYQRYLQESNLTPQDVESQIRGQLLSAKVQEQAVGPVPEAKRAYAVSQFGTELEARWKSRTQCAPGFLALVGSGGFLGAGYVVEGNCLGGSKGKGALKESIEQIKKLNAEGRLEGAGHSSK